MNDDPWQKHEGRLKNTGWHYHWWEDYLPKFFEQEKAKLIAEGYNDSSTY